MKTIAIIPARGGSKGIPRKNLHYHRLWADRYRDIFRFLDADRLAQQAVIEQKLGTNQMRKLPFPSGEANGLHNITLPLGSHHIYMCMFPTVVLRQPESSPGSGSRLQRSGYSRLERH